MLKIQNTLDKLEEIVRIKLNSKNPLTTRLVQILKNIEEIEEKIAKSDNPVKIKAKKFEEEIDRENITTIIGYILDILLNFNPTEIEKTPETQELIKKLMKNKFDIIISIPPSFFIKYFQIEEILMEKLTTESTLPGENDNNDYYREPYLLDTIIEETIEIEPILEIIRETTTKRELNYISPISGHNLLSTYNILSIIEMLIKIEPYTQDKYLKKEIKKIKTKFKNNHEEIDDELEEELLFDLMELILLPNELLLCKINKKVLKKIKKLQEEYTSQPIEPEKLYQIITNFTPILTKNKKEIQILNKYFKHLIIEEEQFLKTLQELDYLKENINPVIVFYKSTEDRKKIKKLKRWIKENDKITRKALKTLENIPSKVKKEFLLKIIEKLENPEQGR